MRRNTPEHFPSVAKNQNIRNKFEYMNWKPEEDTILTINYIDSSGIPGLYEFNLIPNFTSQHASVDIEQLKGSEPFIKAQ